VSGAGGSSRLGTGRGAGNGSEACRGGIVAGTVSATAGDSTTAGGSTTTRGPTAGAPVRGPMAGCSTAEG
jgi:hypothetical protein